MVLGHERPLLPVFEDFPVDGDLQGHDLALDYLSFVEAHSGTDGWEWALRSDDRLEHHEFVDGGVHMNGLISDLIRVRRRPPTGRRPSPTLKHP